MLPDGYPLEHGAAKVFEAEGEFEFSFSSA
jgi:hypothetical protein